jgi:tRNA pseudouridine55 synthase
VLQREGEYAEIELECSSGTYVRQLVAGLGDAYCAELERTAIGPFRLEAADPERIVPLAEALSFLPQHELDAAEAERVSHGVPVPGSTPADVVRLTHGPRIVAIAEPREDRLKPMVVFPA